MWGLCCTDSEHLFLALRGPGSVRVLNLNSASNDPPYLESDAYRCEDPNGIVRGLCFVAFSTFGHFNASQPDFESQNGVLLLSVFEWGLEGLVILSFECHEWRLCAREPSVTNDCGGAFYFSLLGPDNCTSNVSGAALVLAAPHNAKDKSLHLLKLTRAYQIEELTSIQMSELVQMFAARTLPRESRTDQLVISIAIVQFEYVVLYQCLMVGTSIVKQHELSRVNLSNPYYVLWVGSRLFTCYRRTPQQDFHAVVELDLQKRRPVEHESNAPEYGGGVATIVPLEPMLDSFVAIDMIKGPQLINELLINHWCPRDEKSIAIHDMHTRSIKIYSV